MRDDDLDKKYRVVRERPTMWARKATGFKPSPSGALTKKGGLTARLSEHFASETGLRRVNSERSHSAVRCKAAFAQRCFGKRHILTETARNIASPRACRFLSKSILAAALFSSICLHRFKTQRTTPAKRFNQL